MYKIEIWQYGTITETYESNNVEEVLDWYKWSWRNCYDCGGCAFGVYKDGEELSFDEVYALGFYS